MAKLSDKRNRLAPDSTDLNCKPFDALRTNRVGASATPCSLLPFPMDPHVVHGHELWKLGIVRRGLVRPCAWAMLIGRQRNPKANRSLPIALEILLLAARFKNCKSPRHKSVPWLPFHTLDSLLPIPYGWSTY